MKTKSNQIACHLDIILDNGKKIHFYPRLVHDTLKSLTRDKVIIKRCELLIIAQLSSYKEIKLHELKSIIYDTLKQLNYNQLAVKYYKKEFYKQLDLF
ncbi:hypothetical protein WR164_13000 [Philodulcilactobacillus myokoensis]|uniref:Uncharacterized protein n=1 Tax=Philodulcilactobacillus myokoensis TaxID=2929573 RepID=A0A9W6B1Z6_9LACO|nr:hypothetical protein [Philodulcilactobacillus myokoensis]GLB47321.1 hypothetical protein WR164_13000 [Philodulcilactobacillus myokoensis]